MNRVQVARSMLFVPGDRPDRFARARQSGADCVVIDLEDAVPPSRKGAARQCVVNWFVGGGTAVVRVNGVMSPWHAEDIDALRGLADATVMVPKAESADEVGHLSDCLGGRDVIALIETARGVLNVNEIAAARGVVRLALGVADLANELGVQPDSWEAFQYVRSRIVLASAAAGISAPVDGIVLRLDDPAQLQSATQRAYDLGFSGKLCIHPSQVDVVNTILQQDASEMAWAARVIEATNDESGVVVVDGQMVDRPIIERAHAINRSSGPPTHEPA